VVPSRGVIPLLAATAVGIGAANLPSTLAATPGLATIAGVVIAFAPRAVTVSAIVVATPTAAVSLCPAVFVLVRSAVLATVVVVMSAVPTGGTAATAAPVATLATTFPVATAPRRSLSLFRSGRRARRRAGMWLSLQVGSRILIHSDDVMSGTAAAANHDLYVLRCGRR
jgi:hypothetical protein